MTQPQFKYAIGQTLALKEAVEQMDREKNVPPRLTVCSRLFEECHGGVQILYVVRLVTTGFNGGMFDVNLHRVFEFELVPYPALPEKDNGAPTMTPAEEVESAAKNVERWKARLEIAQFALDTAKKRASKSE